MTRTPRIKRWKVLLILLIAIAAIIAPSTAVADSGIDSASYQRCWDGAQAKAGGVNFAFIKLTQGTGYTNPYASCQISTARANNIRLGAYHYANVTGNTPLAEANHFLTYARANGMIGSGVIPVLDWEPYGNQKTNVAWAKAWLDRVAQVWGTKPLIYMSASVIHEADWTPVVQGNYGLWVAGYPRGYAEDKPRDPGSPPYSVAPWPFAAAWQYSSSGIVNGVGGNVDVNWFYGTEATWVKYANSPIPTTTNTVTKPETVLAKQQPVADNNSLATAVIQGIYGNNPQRHALLGTRYAAVMAIVNARLIGSSTGSTASSTSCVTVRSGNTLSGLFGSSWRSVATRYGLRSPYIIYPGQRYCTTGSTSSGATYTGSHTWRITSGETLSYISGKTGVSISRLASINHITNINKIYAGNTLHY